MSKTPSHISQVPDELRFDHYSENFWDEAPERRQYPREEADEQAETNSVAVMQSMPKVAIENLVETSNKRTQN